MQIILYIVFVRPELASEHCQPASVSLRHRNSDVVHWSIMGKYCCHSDICNNMADSENRCILWMPDRCHIEKLKRIEYINRFDF